MAPNILVEGQPLPNDTLQDNIAEALERKKQRDLERAGNEAAKDATFSGSRSAIDAAAVEPAKKAGVAACSRSQPPSEG